MMEWLRKNDVATRVLSLVCAIFLWFYVVSTDNPDLDKTFSHIAVEFVGTDTLRSNDLIITEGAQSQVSFKITGKSEAIGKVDSDRLRVTADLKNITSPGTYELKYQVSTTVPNITVEYVTRSVPITVDRMISRNVPVDLTLSGSITDGYIFDKHAIKPDAITVTGPETVINRIKCAKAAYSISDLTESTETTIGYALIDNEGNEVKSPYLSTNTPSIQLAMTVRQTGEIPLILNIENYGFITDEIVDVKLDPETIKINGLPEVVSTMNKIDIGSLNLESVFKNEDYELELPLILPNGITSEEGISTVKVVIDPKEVVKGTIEFGAEDLPESTEFTYVSDLLIDVWTMESRLGSLTQRSVDLELVYDPEQLTPGFNELPVKVTSLEDDVIIIGEYTLIVEVPQPDEPPAE